MVTQDKNDKREQSINMIKAVSSALSIHHTTSHSTCLHHTLFTTSRGKRDTKLSKLAQSGMSKQCRSILILFLEFSASMCISEPEAIYSTPEDRKRRRGIPLEIEFETGGRGK